MPLSKNLPPKSNSAEGSFTHSTIEKRRPAIINRAIENDNFPSGICRNPQAFKDGIAAQPVHALQEHASVQQSFLVRNLAVISRQD